MLSMEAVSRTYRGPRGEVAALRSVTLAVQAGEFVAVQGPSGCGKSTLLLAGGALLSLDAGRVLIEGNDIYALPPEARARFRARRIGFVFQQFHLIPYLTVRDNVLAASLAAPPLDPEARADALLARFGIAERAHHLPSELSTGERQRVALARALLNQPVLLLADEPTGNLDEANGATVLGALADFARDGGGVLMVTHDARATSYAHRVLRMADGRAKDEGRSED